MLRLSGRVTNGSKNNLAPILSVNRFGANNQITVWSAIYDVIVKTALGYVEVLSQTLLDLNVTHMSGNPYLRFNQVVRTTVVTNVNHFDCLLLSVYRTYKTYRPYQIFPLSNLDLPHPERDTSAIPDATPLDERESAGRFHTPKPQGS